MYDLMILMWLTLTLSLPMSPVGNLDTLPYLTYSPYVYRCFVVLKIF